MVLLLPGRACSFYILGSCFYPEAARPGYDPAYRCGPLLRLMERWDDFLDRAEAFGLSEGTAGRIWSARASAFLYSRKDCPSVRRTPLPPEKNSALPADEEGEILGCPHLRQGACLLTLPRCEGICMHYRRPER